MIRPSITLKHHTEAWFCVLCSEVQPAHMPPSCFDLNVVMAGRNSIPSLYLVLYEMSSQQTMFIVNFLVSNSLLAN